MNAHPPARAGRPALLSPRSASSSTTTCSSSGVGWNFEPSELGAAFGLVQLEKLSDFLARRRRNFGRLSERSARHPGVFTLPRTLAGLETVWHMLPVLIRPESAVRRAPLQEQLAAQGIEGRMVWTGHVLRQPAFRAIAHRADPQGYPK